MAFTLICHACGQKLTLFDIDVKKRKGSVRCTRCGARVSYDLDKRKSSSPVSGARKNLHSTQEYGKGSSASLKGMRAGKKRRFHQRKRRSLPMPMISGTILSAQNLALPISI